MKQEQEVDVNSNSWTNKLIASFLVNNKRIIELFHVCTLYMSGCMYVPSACYTFYTYSPFFHSKLYVILRRKKSQVTFLHVYHHGSMILHWWLGWLCWQEKSFPEDNVTCSSFPSFTTTHHYLVEKSKIV